MLSPTFHGERWGVARYASQCDMNTKQNTVQLRVLCFCFMEVTYLQDQNVGTTDHSKQKAVLNMTYNFVAADKKKRCMVASDHKQRRNRL